MTVILEKHTSTVECGQDGAVYDVSYRKASEGSVTWSELSLKKKKKRVRAHLKVWKFEVVTLCFTGVDSVAPYLLLEEIWETPKWM